MGKIAILLFGLLLLNGCNLFPVANRVNVNQADNSIQPASFNFFAAGNIVKNNPGLKPDTWYLVYEQPGAPALTVELKFDAKTICVIDQTSVPCPISSADFFQRGENVSVRGNKNGDSVLVSEITKQAMPGNGLNQ